MKDIILASPCADGIANTLMIYASSSLNIKQILRVGGAQAIAALAFGTETVDKGMIRLRDQEMNMLPKQRGRFFGKSWQTLLLDHQKFY